MKKFFWSLFFVVLIMCESGGGTINLGQSCDSCVNFVSCVANAVYPNVAAQNCNSYDVADYSDAAAICLDKYPAVAEFSGTLAENARDITNTYWYDKTCDRLENDRMNETHKTLAGRVLESCVNIGYCYCTSGAYIQPRGISALKWGINSECLRCPTNGLSYENSIFITSCFLVPGNFSDETGSGILSDFCYASYGEDDDLTDW